MSYAEGTSVTAMRSQAEIQSLLRKHGAQEFGTMEGATKLIVVFRMKGLTVRLTVPFPARDDKRFTQGRYGRRVSENCAAEKWQQEVRRVWRCMLLLVKAKLEAVASGITTFEHEFMADVATDNGQTVFERMQPALTDGRIGPAVNRLLEADDGRRMLPGGDRHDGVVAGSVVGGR